MVSIFPLETSPQVERHFTYGDKGRDEGGAACAEASAVLLEKKLDIVVGRKASYA